MPNTRNIKLGGRIIALFVGENKNGKTLGIASFPGPILIFNFDGPGRMQPIKLMYPNLEIEYYNVGPKAIKPKPGSDADDEVISYVDFCEIFEKLQDHCPYATVAIDGLTSLSNTAVNFQLINRLGEKGWTQSDMKKTKGGIPIASWDEFNGETTSICMVLDVAKVLPCHMIMTAHPLPKTETNKSGEVIRKYKTLVAYGAKVAAIVPGYFSEIWRFDRVTDLDPNAKPPNKYYVYTTSSGDDIGATALPLASKIDVTYPNQLFQEVTKQVEAHGVKLLKDAKVTRL